MGLAQSYTVKHNALGTFFNALHEAEAPERFSNKFLEHLGFTSTNDRAFITILKDLSFLDSDGKPKDIYYQFLDRSQSEKVLAKAIRDAYSDLFTVNKSANSLSADDVKNKIKVILKGGKSDNVLNRISKTFNALCQLADFSTPIEDSQLNIVDGEIPLEDESKENPPEELAAAAAAASNQTKVPPAKKVGVSSLQYHINIVLPESKNQEVYDAIFKSMREHLG